MIRRKVQEISANRGNKEYTLVLECGHKVKRRDSGKKKPPLSTYCDPCQMILDRLDLIGDLASAKQLKSSIEILKFLEREGLVEAVRAHYSQTIYWKRKKLEY